MSVTVLGLGEMGSALAVAFVAGGHRTTVWNRTPDKVDALVARGAVGASTAAEAVAASDLVVVSVKGDHVVRDILASTGDAPAGRSVVNLTDGTSDGARQAAAWVAERGASYVHGQIMTIAPGVGHPDAVVFYGGDGAAYARHRHVLESVGGRGTYLGEDPGTPAAFGLAVHDTMWGALNGFLHAAALLTSQGIGVARFLEHAGTSLTGLLGYLPSLADEVDRGEYAVPFGALKHHLPSVVDVVRESRDRGVDDGFPSYTARLVRAAVEAGHGDDSYSRLVERFRHGQAADV